MTYVADLANSYLHWENVSTATVQQRTTGADRFDELSYAKKLDATTTRQSFGGIELRTDQVGWLLADPELSQITELRKGDLIHEDAQAAINADTVTWEIDRAERVHFDHQWLILAHRRR